MAQTPAERRQELEDRFRQLRDSTANTEAVTLQQMRTAYRQATRALQQEINQLGPRSIHRQNLQRILRTLETVEATLNADTMAGLQSGILTTSRQAAIDAMRDYAMLTRTEVADSLTAPVRGMFQSTSEVELWAYLNRRNAGGLTLSDTVWNTTRQHWRTPIEDIIQNAIATGLSAQETAVQLAPYVQPQRRPPSPAQQDVMGTGVPEFLKQPGAQNRWQRQQSQLDWRALRLARTEINTAAREATVAVHGRSPFLEGWEWRVSENYLGLPPCAICHALAAGSPYAPSNAPMPGQTHPNCRCVLVPVYADRDAVTSRLESWTQGGDDAELDQWSAGLSV